MESTTREWLVKTQNEWMRRYIEEPKKFNVEFQTIAEFVEQETAGKTPSYGETCTLYMEQLMREMQDAEGVSP